MRFTGPFLHYAETTPQTYALQIGPDLYIGASGGLDDFVNHSCDPNAGVRIEGTAAELFAIRDIAAGEEILFDYSTTLDEEDFTMDCRCGSPSCRGRVGDGRDLPDDVWQRYLGLGITPGVRPQKQGPIERRAGLLVHLHELDEVVDLLVDARR